MKITPWTTEEAAYLEANWDTMTYRDIGEALGRTAEGVKRKAYKLRRDAEVRPAVRLPESGYPRYDKPLERTGDCVILPDLEIPFHHADFINRVLDLACTWGISQAILAGDALHLDSFSTFDRNWKAEHKGGLDDKQKDEAVTFVQKLPDEFRDEGVQLLERIGALTPDADVSGEMGEARKVFRLLAQAFPGGIDWVMGNHEGRALRIFQSPLMPSELLVQVNQGNNPLWRTAPYYYSHLDTCAGRYQIEHPKSAAKTMPAALANKFLCHVLAGHSHDWSLRRDLSGQHWAIAMGHCVDETRLAYAAQRHTTRDAHRLGAVIVRDGYPWLLGEESPWEGLKRL